MEAQGQFMQVDMSSLCLERCRWWSPQCIKGEGNNERRRMSIQGNGVATHIFVFNILKHLMGVFVLLFWRLSTMTQCHPMSTSDPHIETAFSRQRYIVLKPEGLRAVYYVEWHWGCSITANTKVHLVIWDSAHEEVLPILFTVKPAYLTCSSASCTIWPHQTPLKGF